jgi:hypothetical protein
MVYSFDTNNLSVTVAKELYFRLYWYGDIALYMQGPGFEPRTPHLFTLSMEFLAARLFDKKKRGNGRLTVKCS